MPRALIDALDPRIARLVSRRLPGDRRARRGRRRASSWRSCARTCRATTSASSIPAATARTGQPHVRTHVPERALITWILLDVSPSMAFGTAAAAEGRRRRGRGARARAARGAPRRQRGDARVRRRRAAAAGAPQRPAGGRRTAAAARGGHRRGTAPTTPRPSLHALARAGRLASQPGLVAVISDFREQRGWERPLGALALHHSVLAIEIGDPREHELPAVGRVVLVDPETGEDTELDTGDRRVRERFATPRARAPRAGRLRASPPAGRSPARSPPTGPG